MTEIKHFSKKAAYAAFMAGWRSAHIVDENTVILQIARQSVQISFVPAALEAFFKSTELTGFEIVLVGTPHNKQSIDAFKLSCKALKVHSLLEAELDGWLADRLGPIASLCPNGPIRRLTEHLRCSVIGLQPTSPARISGEVWAPDIAHSLQIGDLGFQAILTLFQYTRGAESISDVSKNQLWMDKDVDLLLRDASFSPRMLPVEVKNEDKATGNLVLEKYSCLEKKTPGWFTYSKAEVLVSCFWPTGDVIFLDMEQTRDWVARKEDTLRLVKGSAPGQRYHSYCYLAPIARLLDEVPDSVALRLPDWLDVYKNTFKKPSLLSTKHDGKLIRPA